MIFYATSVIRGTVCDYNSSVFDRSRMIAVDRWNKWNVSEIYVVSKNTMFMHTLTMRLQSTPYPFGQTNPCIVALHEKSFVALILCDSSDAPGRYQNVEPHVLLSIKHWRVRTSDFYGIQIRWLYICKFRIRRDIHSFYLYKLVLLNSTCHFLDTIFATLRPIANFCRIHKERLHHSTKRLWLTSLFHEPCLQVLRSPRLKISKWKCYFAFKTHISAENYWLTFAIRRITTPLTSVFAC